MKKQFFFLLLIVQAVFSFAQPATVDTVSFYSKALQKNTKAVVIKPLAYPSKQSFPVLYLLHGYSGDCIYYMVIPAIIGIGLLKFRL